MTHGQRDGDDTFGATGPLRRFRERVTVRRRRRRTSRDPKQLAAVRERRRRAWILALSAGFMLLMALGLYYGLSRADGGSPQGTGLLGPGGRA